MTTHESSVDAAGVFFRNSKSVGSVHPHPDDHECLLSFFLHLSKLNSVRLTTHLSFPFPAHLGNSPLTECRFLSRPLPVQLQILWHLRRDSAERFSLASDNSHAFLAPSIHNLPPFFFVRIRSSSRMLCIREDFVRGCWIDQLQRGVFRLFRCCRVVARLS